MARGAGQSAAVALEARSGVGDEDVYQDLARQYRERLTDDEAGALSSYSRTVHDLVNRALRGRGSASDVYFAQPWVETLSAALDKAVETDAPMVLYRGFSDKSFYRRRLRAGNVLTDPGFCSTSIHQRSVQRFANEHYAATDHKPEPHRVYWTIQVPAGAKIAPLGNLADNPFEYECLLRAGTRFKVLDVSRSRRNGGELHLALELLL